MSELLMVLPAGWTEITWDQIATTSLDYNSVQALVASNALQELEPILKVASLIPADKSLSAVKLLSTMENSHFIVKIE